MTKNAQKKQKNRAKKSQKNNEIIILKVSSITKKVAKQSKRSYSA